MLSNNNKRGCFAKKSIEILALCFLVMPLASITASTTKTIDMQKTQAPGYFRYMFGNYEITSIYDGFTIGDSSVYMVKILK